MEETSLMSRLMSDLMSPPNEDTSHFLIEDLLDFQRQTKPPSNVRHNILQALVLIQEAALSSELSQTLH